ncbi:FAD-dependent monooxygenase [Amycolatopsis sp. NBC_01307]|uniref:FAD-dependent oxidoreductase n=1 Tax=Amycolatopsis sp. NBC_01307 TaxID=2903561 RepID=UPI002E12AF45|nr:FAD-dependent monooxygenase [Amycolatopsis sp. NBC_01307]
MRVAVIGAGLGGLCLAQGLRKAGIDVDVFERDPGVRARFQGYRIGLADVGREALLACLPDRLHPLLDAVTGDLHGRRVFHDTQLRQLRELEPMTAIAVDRHVLRHLLLDGIDVRFGKRFTGYQGTRAGFADGTHVDADLIVGADGITSAVRGRLAPDLRPSDTGVRCVVGRTTLTPEFESLVPGFGTGVSDGAVQLMLGLMRFRRPPREAGREFGVELPDTPDYVRWVLLPAPDVPVKAVEGWHPRVRALVEAADPAHSAALSIRVVRPERRWAPGRVTLLGDAIHATSPSGGNGANTALYDARLLRDLLVEKAVPEAVEEYETQMLAYGAQAVEHSVAVLDQFLPERAGPRS